MKNGNPEPKIEVIDGEFITLNGEYITPIDDDYAELRKFLRKCVPELWEVMKPWHDRLKAGEKLTLLELFAMLELWREQTAFLWMGHSPRQQKGFEELIRDVARCSQGPTTHLRQGSERTRTSKSGELMPSSFPRPNWDTPTDWQPVNMGTGRFPSWWNWPPDPPLPAGPPPASNNQQGENNE